MLNIEGFRLDELALNCSSCQFNFGTTCILFAPDVSLNDRIEADFHRVLPDARIRGAMVAVCPGCNAARATETFKRLPLRAAILPQTKVRHPLQKFACAIQWGRDNNVSGLDLSLIAQHGWWCARELGEHYNKWIQLAIYEAQRGLAQEKEVGDLGTWHYLLGEMYRQLGEFQKAIDAFDQVPENTLVPEELLFAQRSFAAARDGEPKLLPKHLVKEYFFLPDEDVVIEVPEIGNSFNAPPPPVGKSSQIA